MYDIVIIGAGPAGATLARLVGPDHKVLLIDRRPLDRAVEPGGRWKCCGGLLAPDAQNVLGQMGLGLPQSVASGLDGAVSRYRARTRSLAANILGKSLKSPFMYQPHLRSMVLRSGLMSTNLRTPT